MNPRSGFGRRWFVLFAAALLVLWPARRATAADLLRVLPVTDQILMLEFREGRIDYNGVRLDGTYEPQTENRVFCSQLIDAASISDAARYRVTSKDDAAFRDGQNPASAGYKAKGSEFNSPFKKPEYFRTYWVYLELPKPMISGKSYTVQVADLAENLNGYTFTYDEKRLRSPAIHISQAGFSPDAPKFAYFSQWMGTFQTPQHPAGALDLSRYKEGVFHLCDARSGDVRRTYRGLRLQKSHATKDPSFGNWTGADVYSLDFSDFKEPGRYFLAAEGMGRSYPFVIGDQAYAGAHRAVMRGVFLQRRGIFKDFAEFGREYPRSHHPDMNEFVAGTVKGEGVSIDDPKPVKGIWGWYADAGDWDGNPTHYVVPLSLLLTYDLRPENFHDGDIGNRWKERAEDPWVEEGRNGVPDILDEARWWLDFARRARTELKRQGLGTGGVPRYAGRDAGAETNPAWADARVQWIDRGVAETTYSYAAGAAYLAHCLDEHYRLERKSGAHPESAGWLAEARDAFGWAEAQTEHSETDRRQRQLAAMSLYLTTGEQAFQEIFKTEWNADSQRTGGAWVSPGANQFASAIYLVSCKKQPDLDTAFYEEVKKNIIGRANYSTNITEEIGFRFGGVEPGQGVGMNLFTVPRTLFQMTAYEVTGEQKYLDAIHTAVAYVLGGNQEGRSHLSGVGFAREQDAFICDAWYLLDFNHPAYRNPIFPGLSAYAIPTFDVGGPGSENWARSSTLPKIDGWPVGEQRMRSRYSIAGSEFTIHQNHPWYVMATGYLLSKSAPVAPIAAPTVKLHIEAPAGAVAIQQPLQLSVKASAGTERVEYYYDWHFAGESSDASNGFALAWDASQTTLNGGEEVLITAIAYDEQGEPSQPTPGGEKKITLQPRK